MNTEWNSEFQSDAGDLDLIFSLRKPECVPVIQMVQKTSVLNLC